jgi:predicted dehydrogenase
MNRLLEPAVTVEHARGARLPRVGFLGVGWIGRNRLEALAASRVAEIEAIADPVRELAIQAGKTVPEANLFTSLDELLESPLDGIVIATPSAMHAEQSEKALNAGLAVFCQKPLGRNALETAQVIEAAKTADRLLGVDLSYRTMSGMRAVRDLIHCGELGDVFASEFVFHNAFGPDKSWFYRRSLSGGGCVVDLGIHLVDLALWMLGVDGIRNVESRLYVRGKPLQVQSQEVEDFASARLDLEDGSTAQLSCSWNLPAGCDAIIGATFYGTKGGASIRNLNGSFYDFAAERFRGTHREVLVDTPESWGGRAIIEWARRLQIEPGFDPEIERLNIVAKTLDEIYRKGSIS